MYSQQWPPYPPATPEYPWDGFTQQQPYGEATISVTMRYAPIGFLLGLFTPVLAIDGQPVRATWKRPIVMAVAPGQHHVHAHVPYLLPRQIGKADLLVTAVPGQAVELEYRAPLIAFMKGAFGTPPQKYPGMAATIVLLVITLVMAFCAFGTAVLTATSEARAYKPTVSIPPVPTLPTIPPLPTDPARTADEAGQPSLKEGATVRRIAGKAFSAAEKTQTMQFKGWPFAFRTPQSWGCLGARTTVADAKAYICIDEGKPASGTRVAVMVRPCPASCGATERKRLTGEWFNRGAKPREFDDDTQIVEIDGKEQDRYQLAVGHFFSAEGGRRWQVGVDATALRPERADVQKIVNDILTQSS